MEDRSRTVYLVPRAGTAKLDQPHLLVSVIEDTFVRERKLWQLPLELSISSTIRPENRDLAPKVITVQSALHTPFRAKRAHSRIWLANTSVKLVRQPVIAAQLD